MKKFFTTLITLLIFSSFIYSNSPSDTLEVATEGYLVTVVDFDEGDTIKLFEAETGVHILSKTRGYVDLSQLPEGSYVLENTKGQTALLVRRNLELYVPGNLGKAYVVTEDAEKISTPGVEKVAAVVPTLTKDVVATNELPFSMKGNLVTLLDFEEGDKIKLFELKNTIHVLTKYSNFIDLSQLEAGRYFIEDNKGRVAFIEKGLDSTNTI